MTQCPETATRTFGYTSLRANDCNPQRGRGGRSGLTQTRLAARIGSYVDTKEVCTIGYCYLQLTRSFSCQPLGQTLQSYMLLPLLVLVGSSLSMQSPHVDSSTTRTVLLSPANPNPSTKVNLVTQPNYQVKPQALQIQKHHRTRNALRGDRDDHIQPVNPWKIIGMVLIFWVVISSISFPVLCCAIRESGHQDYKGTSQFNGGLQQDRVTDIRLVKVPIPQSELVGNFQTRNSLRSQITIQMVGPKFPDNNSDPSSDAFRSNPPSKISPMSQVKSYSHFKGPNRSYSIGNPLKPEEAVRQQVGESVGTSRHAQDSKSDNMQPSNYSVQQAAFQVQILDEEANGDGNTKPDEPSEDPFDIRLSAFSNVPRDPQVLANSEWEDSQLQIETLQTFNEVQTNMVESEPSKLLQGPLSLEGDATGRPSSEAPIDQVEAQQGQLSQQQEFVIMGQDYPAKQQGH